VYLMVVGGVATIHRGQNRRKRNENLGGWAHKTLISMFELTGRNVVGAPGFAAGWRQRDTCSRTG
jgi:hypothetical protein